MKIESDGFSKNLYALDKIFSHAQGTSDKRARKAQFIDNGYSSLPQKELNYRTGILQTALKTLQKISDESALPAIKAHIQNAQFFGQKIYEKGFVLKGENGETLFDANTLLDALPSDERDLYLFKKVLKGEIAFVESSLKKLADSTILHENIAESGANIAESSLDSAPFDYLTNNANLFSKAHNTASLRNKIDALLA